MGDTAEDAVQIKLVVVGDGAVGKTCLLMSYCKDEIPEGYIPTVFDNYVVSLTAGGKIVELALYDTAGQEEYDRLRPLSYGGAHVLLICFSVMSPTSLQNVKTKWIKEVRHYRPEAPIILVGTKSDLRKNKDALAELAKEEESPVSEDQARKVMKEIGAEEFVECSAITKFNLKEVFDEAIKAVMLAEPEPKRKKHGRCELF